MPIKVSFKGVASAGFDPFPANEPQEFTIFDITLKDGKEFPYLNFEYNHADSNRKAWNVFSLSPKALPFLKKLLIDVGVDPDELEDEFEFEPNDILGEEVYLTFGEPEIYQGSEVQNVVRVAAR